MVAGMSPTNNNCGTCGVAKNSLKLIAHFACFDSFLRLAETHTEYHCWPLRTKAIKAHRVVRTIQPIGLTTQVFMDKVSRSECSGHCSLQASAGGEGRVTGALI